VPLVLTTSRIKTIPVAMSDFFTFERELEGAPSVRDTVGEP